MFKLIFKIQYILQFLIILIAATFFLSVIGKYFDLDTFKKSMSIYGLPSFTAYLILIIEMYFAFSFMFLFFLRKTSAFSISFLILMTIVYAVGHFYFEISSCSCFGIIEFLNPANFLLFLIKNIALIITSLFIFNYSPLIHTKIWRKRLLTVLATMMLSFLAIKYNEYYFDNYSRNKIGYSIKDLNINMNEIKNIEYLFVFSPICSHCLEAIPKINSINKKYPIKLVGITIDSMEKELNKVASDLAINFNVIKINKKIFNELTKLVPVIYQIKNDTIQNSFNPSELLVNIISTEKKNYVRQIP